jgi:hypothetical protein
VTELRALHALRAQFVDVRRGVGLPAIGRKTFDAEIVCQDHHEVGRCFPGMRGLCAASHLERVQDEVCTRTVSLGSFSEAQGVFDSELLKGVFLDLVAENQTSWGDARLSRLADKLKLVDGTLLPALPRMHWALWLNDQNRAAKLHLKFSGLRQGACDGLITAGNSCERKALRQFVKKGEIIVADRYYGLEYGFFGELKQIGASHVIRMYLMGYTDLEEVIALLGVEKTAK